MTNRLRCDECLRAIGSEADMLSAPHAFIESDTIRGCPHCGEVAGWTQLCDEPACDEPTTCGTPIQGSYRRTCYRHRPDPTGRDS